MGNMKCVDGRESEDARVGSEHTHSGTGKWKVSLVAIAFGSLFTLILGVQGTLEYTGLLKLFPLSTIAFGLMILPAVVIQKTIALIGTFIHNSPIRLLFLLIFALELTALLPYIFFIWVIWFKYSGLPSFHD